jgi:hypothetical protein
MDKIADFNDILSGKGKIPATTDKLYPILLKQ